MSFSANFIYTLVKKLDGISGGGSTGWWSCRVDKIYGQCSESIFPTDTSVKEEDLVNKVIPEQAYSTARQFKTMFYQYYQRIYTKEECLEALKMSPLSLSFDCFEGIHKSKNGYIPLPSVGEKHTGNHTVTIYGYSKKHKNFKFMNSWGAEWGDKGHGYLPSEYFREGLISEVWGAGLLPIQEKEKYGVPKIYDLEGTNKRIFKVYFSILPSLRKPGSAVYIFDIFSTDNIQIGCAHASLLERGVLEIEDLFIIPDFQRAGIGTAFMELLYKMAKTNSINKIVGWISAQDLIDDREVKVIGFYNKNGYSIIDDYTKFRDCFYRIEKSVA